MDVIKEDDPLINTKSHEEYSPGGANGTPGVNDLNFDLMRHAGSVRSIGLLVQKL
jgi:hypothetical protein